MFLIDFLFMRIYKYEYTCTDDGMVHSWNNCHSYDIAAAATTTTTTGKFKFLQQAHISLSKRTGSLEWKSFLAPIRYQIQGNSKM